MARSNNFQVRVTSDTSQFDAGMRRAQQSLRAFSNVARTAFSVVGFTSFATALTGAVKNIADFEKANSELAAVLGTNLQGVEQLSQAAKELGRQSKYTASEVTALQVSLARLGFNDDQIQAMQASILNFATAMDTDLASAADFTGAALRAFGLQATDTERLLDVMSAATTKSALDFSKLQTSIAVVAPIAKSFGLNVQETAAFLGVLSNNGFDASSAATALRNILLNLADANGKLAQGIGHSATSFDEIIQAFQELSDRGVDVAQVLNMTDKRSAAAAITIIKQAGAVADLKNALDGAEGSLTQMSDTMKDNLIGSVNNLKSAWEGFTLSLSESKGVMKAVVDGLTNGVNAMTDKLENGVTLLEALLGPIAGSALSDWLLPKREDNPGDAAVPGSARGGGGRVGSSAPAVVPETETSTGLSAEAVKAAADAKKKAYEELANAAKAAAEEAAEINAADEEMLEYENELYERWKVMADLPPIQPFDNDVLLRSAQILKDINDEMELQAYLDKQLDDMASGLSNTMVDFSQQAQMLAETGLNALGESLGGLFADLATGGDAWGNFANAALSSFGDMAVSIGRIAISAGVASLGIKAALESLNGWAAIAAGTALVALGAAVKSGLANVASGNYSASASVASGSYNYGASDYETRELNVNVSGTLQADGSQLVAVLNNTNNKNGYTT